MLDQPFPDLLLQLQPVPFRDALLDAADQDGGGVDAFDVGGLVGGEQRDALPGEFFFQFQGVEHVPAGPLDVLADHGGEPGRGRGGLAQQVGHPPVTREAGLGELLVGIALAAVLQVDAAGLDIPVHGGDEPAGRQPFPGRSELAAQRRAGVLERERGGPADERDRDRFGGYCPFRAGGHEGHWLSGCWLSHCSTSMMTAACRASISLPRFPVAILSLYRTLIPSGLSSSLRL
jgi:hypothetical protein